MYSSYWLEEVKVLVIMGEFPHLFCSCLEWDYEMIFLVCWYMIDVTQFHETKSKM